MDYLVLLPMIGGLIIVGGGIVLLYRGKIVLSSDNSATLIVDLPGIGKVSSTSTSISLFVIGAVMLLAPVFYSQQWQSKMQTMQDKIDNPPTVTIRGVVSADDPPVAVYVSGENTAVQGVAEYSLRIPKYKMMRDHDIICTSGKVFTTLHLSSDSLLARDFIRVVDIVFPRNETADMPRTAAAYNELTSLPLNP